jgi:ankyrin repeat protein
MLATADDEPSIELLVKAGGTVVARDDGQVRKADAAPLGMASLALAQDNEPLALAALRHKRASPGSDCGAIYVAAAGGYDRALAALLDAGWPRDVESAEGLSPLHAAAAAGHAGAVQLLLDRRAYPVDLATPRVKADLGADPEAQKNLAARLLLEALALEAMARSGGATPLMLAAGSGRVEVAKRLLAARASVNAKDDAGRTALDYARQGSPGGRREAIERVLAAAGAKEGSGASFSGGFMH